MRLRAQDVERGRLLVSDNAETIELVYDDQRPSLMAAGYTVGAAGLVMLPLALIFPSGGLPEEDDTSSPVFLSISSVMIAVGLGLVIWGAAAPSPFPGSVAERPAAQPRPISDEVRVPKESRSN